MIFNRRRDEPPPGTAWDDPLYVPEPAERWLEPEEVAERLRRRRGRWRALRHAVVLLLIITVVGGTGVIAGGAVLGRWELPWSPQAGGAAEPTATAVAPVDCEPAVVVPAGIAGTSVEVLNSTSRNGLAGSVSDELEGRGFTVVDVGNASGDREEAAVVRFPDGAEPAALAVAAHLQGAVLEPAPDLTVVTVVLGEQWTGLNPVEVAAEEARQPRPSVVTCAGQPGPEAPAEPTAPTG